MYSREDWQKNEEIEAHKGSRNITNIAERKPFMSVIDGPFLSKRFVCKLNDGWYLIRRTPLAYHGRPIDGWRVWWWKFVTIVEATWRGFGMLRL